MGCGDISFLEGGTLNNSTLINAQVANAELQSSTFDNGTIKELANIDNSSLEKISDGIANLSTDKLLTLFRALISDASAKEAVLNLLETMDAAKLVPLLKQLLGDDSAKTFLVDTLTAMPAEKLAPLFAALFETVTNAQGSSPSTNEGTELPTTVYGDRRAVLGAPSAWQKLGNSSFMIPVYTTES